MVNDSMTLAKNGQCTPHPSSSNTLHRGQNLKQINIKKYVSKVLIRGAKMTDKCVKSQRKFFVHCPFLQSQAK